MTAARRRSPAEMCTRPNFSTMSSHWVPLPDAGAPAMTILLGPVPAMDTMDVRAEEARTAEREAAENFLVVALPLVNWVFTAGAAEAERAKDIGVVVVAGVVCGCARREW